MTPTAPALRLCIEASGLRVLRLDARRRIERERFLYLRAVKP